MTIKTTRWSPDTCGCSIDYQWDDSLPNDQITITPVGVPTKCAAHSSIAAVPTAFNTISEENGRKNISRSLLLDNGPSTLYDIVDGNRQFKTGIDISWAWSGTAPNRVITITVTGITLTNAQKNTVRNVLNNRFGAGKVVLA
jgi:hypothetical protein